MTRRTPRTYTYRIHLDDRASMIRLRRFQRKEDYFISEVHKSNVPNSGSSRHWACVFYESREHFSYEKNEMVGGSIPGLGDCRYSLDWEPMPQSSLLEMRHANGGGTKIKGEYRYGTDDPRTSDYVPVNMTVPWTPSEIEAMWDGEEVPNKRDFTRDPPMMEAPEARDALRRMIEVHAKSEGDQKRTDALHEWIEECDHKVLETGDRWEPGYCEDCGKVWRDRDELDATVESGEAIIVGTA